MRTLVKLGSSYMVEPVMFEYEKDFEYRDARELDVSDELKMRIYNWDRDYQKTLDHNDPGGSSFSTVEAAQAHIKEGAKLASRLQEEMGESYLVEYRPVPVR